MPRWMEERPRGARVDHCSPNHSTPTGDNSRTQTVKKSAGGKPPREKLLRNQDAIAIQQIFREPSEAQGVAMAMVMVMEG